jgi:RNA polymerase sigma factor (sigma-70 family)
MTDDTELLRKFVEESSEAAFRDLVSQRIGFVYAAALRQVGGDAHLAQEVAQNVFLDMARKARALKQRPTIAGWLFTSTLFAASKVLRSRARRLKHETEAHAMNEILSASSGTETKWNELSPVLDDAMHELGSKDREAILLRYFDGRSLAEVGSVLGLAENSARMRVDRALEKLRIRLARRGITSTTATLGVVLAAQPTVVVPAGLGTTVAGASLAGAAVGGGTALGTVLLAITVAVAIGIGTYAGFDFFSDAKSRQVTSDTISPATPAQTLPTPVVNLQGMAPPRRGSKRNR